MIKAIIFDYFDVLVRDDYWHQVNEKAELTGEHERIDTLNIGVNSGALSWAEFCNQVAELMGVTPNTVDDSYHQLKLNKLLVLYVKELKDRGYKVGLLSNAASEYLRPILRESGLDIIFDAIAISTEIDAIKPNINAYLEAAKQLGVSPGEAIMLDDAMRNVAGAETAGLQAVQYKTFEQAKADIENLLANHAQ
jgi:HAD superfamily hydrolase (TIGR01509 family)